MVFTAVLVDNDVDDLELLKRQIDKHHANIRCICFDDPVDALRAITEEFIVAPDYIVTDVNMPKMNGDELVAELRKRPEFNHTVICVLSTHMPGDSVQKMKKIGADYAFQKPTEFILYKGILAEVFSKDGR
jgi:CheY-like chemotaxis protein